MRQASGSSEDSSGRSSYARLGKIVPINHALTAWLLEYAALLLTGRYVGTDGRTAWCHARGRNFRMDALNFGDDPRCP